MSLFIGVVGKTNAWFTAEHNNGVEIVVQIGALKLSLYQQINSTTANVVYSYDENSNKTDMDKKYILLSGAIEPDVSKDLNLYVSNDDSKSVPMYLRYKFELFVRGETIDTQIPVSIAGFTVWVTGQTGMKQESDGFYYYTGADGSHALLAKGESKTIMTTFKIDYADMVNSLGNAKFTYSESVYIKLTIEGSAVDWE